MDNEYRLNKTIANRLKKKGAVDDVKEDICRDNLLDECTGEKAAGNFLDKEQAKYDEGETENLKKAVPDKVVVDSDGEEAHLLIKKEAELGKGKRGDHVMNALQLASPYSKVMQLIDVLMETNLYATAAPKCTPDAKNDNMVKAGLKKAIIDSDVDEVRSLIEMGADLSKTTWGKGMNALHVASKYAKTTEILDVILSSGQFDINGSDEDGWTPLHNALSTKNMTTAHYLLEKGADPTIRDPNGTTPFHLASAVLTDTDVLGLMLGNEKMIEIDEKNEKGWTALHLAIGKSNVTAVHFLLSNGANPNVTDKDGDTPLHWAAKYAKNMDMVKLLVNHPDVDVNYLDNEGNNALDYAMTNDHGLGEEIANLLREKMAAKAEGNNHESKNIVALVPPGGIKENSDMETIRFLIENGQDISKLTWGENGANALHLAAAHEKTTDLIDAILETGKFDINGVDNDGRTPLHYAINKPHPVTINVRRLIKMGADPSIADKEGSTPLHMAAIHAKSMDLIDELLLKVKTGAVDVNCVDIEGLTPLAYARDNRHHGLSQRIIDRLKEYGAKE